MHLLYAIEFGHCYIVCPCLFDEYVFVDQTMKSFYKLYRGFVSIKIFVKMLRHGNKWSIPEILRLQREFELLRLPISEISKLHNRSEAAIKYKLIAEGFFSSYKL